MKMEIMNQNVFELIVKKTLSINHIKFNIISLVKQLLRSKVQIKMLKAKNEDAQRLAKGRGSRIKTERFRNSFFPCAIKRLNRDFIR